MKWNMKPANALMSSLGTTVFEVMSALARQHQSVNLGQGFPDDKGPEEVRRAAAEYLLDGHNQYPPMMGIPELRQAVAAHTKLILFNTPMNPCSKVFDRDELEFIAGLCVKHDAYAVCDEVYEHIIFDDRRHLSIMTLPGMRTRTARIGSAGKSFSVTGWKVGYVTAAPDMLKPIAKTHQFMTFTTPPNLQWGAATGLRLGDGYYTTLAADMQRKRDRLAHALERIG